MNTNLTFTWGWHFVSPWEMHKYKESQTNKHTWKKGLIFILFVQMFTNLINQYIIPDHKSCQKFRPSSRSKANKVDPRPEMGDDVCSMSPHQYHYSWFRYRYKIISQTTVDLGRPFRFHNTNLTVNSIQRVYNAHLHTMVKVSTHFTGLCIWKLWYIVDPSRATKPK